MSTGCLAGVQWYNFEHRHSGIHYVTPAQRHAGVDRALLAAHDALYTKVRECNPARWSGNSHNWTPAGAVTLNSERGSIDERRDSTRTNSLWLHESGGNYVPG
jgi:putative transposase